jgi:ABC-type glycerol-3-phosphate transport system permease component
MLRQHAGPPFPTDYFLPLVIMVLIFRRRIIAGLIATGVK